MKNKNIAKIIFVMCVLLVSCAEDKPVEVVEPVQENQVKPDTTKPVKQTSQKLKVGKGDYASVNSKKQPLN